MFEYLPSNIRARLVKPEQEYLEICQTRIELYKVKYLICSSLCIMTRENQIHIWEFYEE